MPPANEQPSDPRAASARILRWKQGAPGQAADDSLAREEPLEIRVKGESVAVTMRTPGHDELALGFLLSEGVITGPGDVIEVAPCQQGEAALLGNVLNVFLAPKVGIDLAKLRRNVYASSSCGLCGKASIESVHGHFAPLAKRAEAEVVIFRPSAVAKAQLEHFALGHDCRVDDWQFDKPHGGDPAWLGQRVAPLLVTLHRLNRLAKRIDDADTAADHVRAGVVQQRKLFFKSGGMRVVVRIHARDHRRGRLGGSAIGRRADAQRVLPNQAQS
mgnify:CR=1 FL=1